MQTNIKNMCFNHSIIVKIKIYFITFDAFNICLYKVVILVMSMISRLFMMYKLV